MKIVAISDTHLAEPELPAGDVLIHAGDLTYRGNLQEVASALWWLHSLKHKFKHIVFVAGNHDWLFQKEPSIARSLAMERGLIYLQDSGVVIEESGQAYPWDPETQPDGLRIWGSPWQPEFYDWAFNLPRGNALKEKWDRIPAGTDILVTHGPPLGIRDRAPRKYPEANWHEEDFEFHSEKVGCYDLLQAVKRVKPKYHIFGHIHADYGRAEVDGTIFLNASIMDERYDPTHGVMTFEYSIGSGNGPTAEGSGGAPEAGSGNPHQSDSRQDEPGASTEGGGRAVSTPEAGR